ncbi:hypothetical protein [Tistrella mobilis]|uniref:hypothetical protein n=1 Tax=Tistrella mobilis TaxID=171437 RepID=UPI0035574610
MAAVAEAGAEAGAVPSRGAAVRASWPSGVRTSGRPASSRPRSTTGRAIRPAVSSGGVGWRTSDPLVVAVARAVPSGPVRRGSPERPVSDPWRPVVPCWRTGRPSAVVAARPSGLRGSGGDASPGRRGSWPGG